MSKVYYNIADFMMKVTGRRSQRYKETFSTVSGKWVLGNLIGFAGARDQSFIPGKPDETAFREGMRRIITRIERMCEMTPYDMKKISDSYETEESRVERQQQE